MSPRFRFMRDFVVRLPLVLLTNFGLSLCSLVFGSIGVAHGADVIIDVHRCTCSSRYSCQENNGVRGTVTSPSNRVFENEDLSVAQAACRQNLEGQAMVAGRCRNYDHTFTYDCRSFPRNLDEMRRQAEETQRRRQEQEEEARRRQREEERRRTEEEARREREARLARMSSSCLLRCLYRYRWTSDGVGGDSSYIFAIDVIGPNPEARAAAVASERCQGRMRSTSIRTEQLTSASVLRCTVISD